jgi:hypothetical protein
VLKQHVQEDVLDYPPPVDDASPGESEAAVNAISAGQDTAPPEPTSAAETPADGPYATPQQIASLKLLAQQVGDDAYADVQDMLDHHPEGLIASVYEIVKQRLKARKAAKKKETVVER